MRILGVDSGVNNIGLAIIDSENLSVLYSICYKLSSYSEFYYYFYKFLTLYTPVRLAIEKPFFSPLTIGKNTRTLETIGIQKLIAEQLNISYQEYAPTTIKKRITGNGKASKDEVIEKVQDKFNFITKNTHIADAIAVAYTDILLNVS